MRKIVSITAVTAIVIVLIGAGAFWYMSTQPMYRPGRMRSKGSLSVSLTPPEQSSETGIWQVEDNIRLHYYSHGSGRNVLIVHGGPGYPYQKPWTGLEALSDNYRFLYYDQRGCGDSTRPFDRFALNNRYKNITTLESTLGLSAQVADIERIRRILREEKLILIGHSWGGFLASLYAAEFPEQVEALVLVAPADVLVMPQPEGRGLYDAVRVRLPEDQLEAYDAFLNAYFDFGGLFDKSEADLVQMNEEFARYFALALNEELPEQPGGGGWMVWAMYLSMGQRHDYTASLAAVNAPVLVVHGSEDFQPEAASQEYAQAFPKAMFFRIDGAGHWPFEDQPQAFAQTVREFLTR